MKTLFLAARRKQMCIWGYLPVLFLFLLMPACLASSIHAGEVCQPSPVETTNIPNSQGTRNVVMTSGDACPTNKEFMSKARVLPMPFIANNGQVDGQVAFYAKIFGGTVFVKKDGEIVYSLPSGRDVTGGSSQESGRGHEAWGQGSRGAEGRGGKPGEPDRRLTKAILDAYNPGLQGNTGNNVGTRRPCPPRFAHLSGSQESAGTIAETVLPIVSLPIPLNYHPQSKMQNPQSPLKGVALKETIIGAKIGGITGEQPAVTKVNYFTGNDQSKWKTNIPTYNMVNLGEVYEGIELSLKAYGDNVEKLFCVKPGANPAFIKVQIDGGKSLRVDHDGQLEADTELGPVKFTKPVAYQEIDGKRVEVGCKYTIAECGMQQAAYKTNPQSKIHNPKLEYGFTVASYDKTKDLIIDPMLASTFLGGSGADECRSLSLDTSGNVYVMGYTDSANFPTTVGAYNGSLDVFVSKLNSGLTSLLASTFLGGTGYDWGMSLALDKSGKVYVTGYTDSTNFPTTVGAYDTSFNNSSSTGYYDVFVSKLDSGLTSLLASTYLGGSGGEWGMSLAIHKSGRVYVTGFTGSTDFPTTSGAYDTSFNGSYYYDVFVSKLNSGLTSLLASTYLGGSDWDEGMSLTLDTSGKVYVTGETRSTNFPTTVGAYDTSHNGGYDDIFVSKLNSGLTSLLASTYLGGSGFDWGMSLALFQNGKVVYVTGFTNSVNFPTTSGAYDTSFNNSSSTGYYDVFVSKLNGGLTSLLASTYLGGSNDDRGNSLTIDKRGYVYVTGFTGSTNFPTTSSAYDTSFNSGTYDVFVSKLNSGLTSLPASTYLGESSDDRGNSLALNTNTSGNVNVYVGGVTSSGSFPVTSGAYSTSFNGGTDAFVSELDGNL